MTYYGTNQTYDHVYNKTISGTNLTISGDGNVISGINCDVTGDGNTISGTNAKVHGHRNNVSGTNAKVVGNHNKVTGTNASVHGNDNNVKGTNSSAVGLRNTVSGTNSTNNGKGESTGVSTKNSTGSVVNGKSFNFNSNGDGKRQRIIIDNGTIISQSDNGTQVIQGGASFNTFTDFFGSPPFGSNNFPFDFPSVPSEPPSLNKIEKDTEEWEKIHWRMELDALHDQPAKNTEGACVVCMENAKKCFIVPCKHSCLCIKCSLELYEKEKEQLKCPICRKLVTRIDEIYN